MGDLWCSHGCRRGPVTTTPVSHVYGWNGERFSDGYLFYVKRRLQVEKVYVLPLLSPNIPVPPFCTF